MKIGTWKKMIIIISMGSIPFYQEERTAEWLVTAGHWRIRKYHGTIGIGIRYFRRIIFYPNLNNLHTFPITLSNSYSYCWIESFFFYSWKGTTFRSTHLLPELIKKKKEWSNLLLFLNNLQELCIDSNTLSDGSGDDVYDHRTIVKSSLKVLSFINDSSETAQISWQMKVKFPELPVVACFMASWILIS